MNDPKPIKLHVNSEYIESKDDFDNEIKPHRDTTNASIDVNADVNNTDYDNHEIEGNNKPRHYLHIVFQLMSSIGSIFSAFFILLLFVVLADTIKTWNEISAGNIFSSCIYLFGLLIFLLVLFCNIYSWYKQISSLRNATNIRTNFDLQKQEPNAELIPLASSLLQHYEQSNDPEIQQTSRIIQSQLDSSHLYKDIYHDLNILLEPIGNKATKLVHTAALQTALTTAISPIAIVDIGLIVWRSVRLARDISRLYGFKLGILTTIVLLKKALVNIAFAGITQLSTDFTHKYFASTLSSKIYQAATKGFANGILLARLGYGIIDACRPIAPDEQNISFIKTFFTTLFNALKVNKKTDQEKARSNCSMSTCR